MNKTCFILNDIEATIKNINFKKLGDCLKELIYEKNVDVFWLYNENGFCEFCKNSIENYIYFGQAKIKGIYIRNKFAFLKEAKKNNLFILYDNIYFPLEFALGDDCNNLPLEEIIEKSDFHIKASDFLIDN